MSDAFDFKGFAYVVTSNGEPISLAFTREEAREDKRLFKHAYENLKIVQLVPKKAVR